MELLLVVPILFKLTLSSPELKLRYQNLKQEKRIEYIQPKTDKHKIRMTFEGCA